MSETIVNLENTSSQRSPIGDISFANASFADADYFDGETDYDDLDVEVDFLVKTIERIHEQIIRDLLSATDFHEEVSLSWLAAAADEGDLTTFMRLYDLMDWRSVSGDKLAQAARLALSIGAHNVAKELVTRGVQSHSEHEELQKLAGVLLPGTPKPAEERQNTSWSANRTWLQTHWKEYVGKWVALRDGELLGVAESLRGLISKTGYVKDDDTLLTFID